MRARSKPYPEPTVAEYARGGRYERIHLDQEKADALLVDLFLEAHAKAPEKVFVIDLDAADDHEEEQ